MNHFRAPLFEALIRIRNGHTSFHVPGHKQGMDFDRAGIEFFQEILSLDMTELDGLDDLHHAEGVIAEAEALAANAFGSEETKFLVGGTTAGNLALILGTVRNGGKCLIQRNSHKSIFNGLRLAGGIPVFIPPRFDPNYGVPLGPTVEEVERALEKNPDIQAVFLTSPNYYGQTAEIDLIAEVVHRRNIPLMIDEAHGAHFNFHRDLPRTALEQGADAVVQSTHKTLPAMTMASMLHFQGERIDRDRVKQMLTIIQSSSPSYPLMASLDLARRHMMVGSGQIELDRMIREVKQFKERLQTFSWLQLVPTADPLRIVLNVPQGWGKTIQQHLQTKGIYLEIVEPSRLVLVVTGGNTGRQLEELIQVFESFQYPSKSFCFDHPNTAEYHWDREYIHSNVHWMEKEKILLAEAKDRIAADMIIPYPPGIPFLLPGEKYTEGIIEGIQSLIKQGIHVQGIKDGQVAVIK